MSEPPHSPSRLPLFLCGLGAGAAYGGLSFVSFHPLNFWACAFVAALPLVVFGIMRSRVTAGCAPGWWGEIGVSMGCMGFWLYEHWFVYEITGMGWVPIGVYLSLYSGLFVALLARIHAAFPRMCLTLLVPVLWVGVETLKGRVVFGGYAWYFVSQPLVQSAVLSRFGAAIGASGVSFLVVALAGFACDVARSRRAGERAISRIIPGVFLAACTLGAMALSAPVRDGRTFRVAVIQTNVPQSNKLSPTADRIANELRTLVNLTRTARAENPDLIVWPETMKPGLSLSDESIAELRAQIAHDPGLVWLENDIQIASIVRNLSDEVGVPMLIGAMRFDSLRIVSDGTAYRDEYKGRFNSVFLLNNGEVTRDVYDKMRATPFGERMPYIEYWPWLRDQLQALAAHGMKLDLGAGERPTVFAIPMSQGAPVGVVTPICFEATDAGLCRMLVNGGADVMVNLTNDGWFGSMTRGKYHHLQVARWRCVELGTPMVRSANTGLSAGIDSRGGLILGKEIRPAGVGGAASRSVPHADADTEGVLVLDVPFAGQRTVYARCGDVVGWGSFAGTGVLGLFALVRRRKVEAAVRRRSFGAKS